MKILQIHRITAVLMAMMIFISSISFSIDMHYCQNNLIDISFIGKAKPCYEKKQAAKCSTENEQGEHIHFQNASLAFDHNCCHNKTIIFDKLVSDVTSTFVTFKSDLQTEYTIGYITTNHNSEAIEFNFQSFTFYRPPLPDRDLFKLHQVFLI